MNETDEQIKKRLHDIFPDPATASKVVDLVVSKKPPGWSRHSNAPYYKEEFALQIKKWIDLMLQNGGDIIYRWDIFCEDVSRNTLYNKVNQSIRYLIERMDENGKYQNWYNTVDIDRTNSVGLRIKFRTSTDAHNFTPQLVKPEQSLPKWRRDLDEWLEDDKKTKPFCEEGLALSPEEIKQLKTELYGLVGIVASITSYAIKVIKERQ